MIEKMGEKDTLLKAQLDVLLELDLTHVNILYLIELCFEIPTI